MTAIRKSGLCTACNSGRKVGTGVWSGHEDKQYCIDNGLCFPCGDEGQMDIQHLNGHEHISEDDCWGCHPEMNEALKPHTPRTGTSRVGAANSAHHSHIACYVTKGGHERTPEARAACRATHTWNDDKQRWIKNA